jgi:hypothetical protein
MMKRASRIAECLVLGWLILTSSLVGQVEHAPTVAQCQSDQRLWMSKLEGDNPSALPEYSVLGKWGHEMRDCQEVDPDNKLTYYNTQEEVNDAQYMRMMHFIVRHDMWQKFLDEDAAGKR